jgi:hypothetical protein
MNSLQQWTGQPHGGRKESFEDSLFSFLGGYTRLVWAGRSAVRDAPTTFLVMAYLGDGATPVMQATLESGALP